MLTRALTRAVAWPSWRLVPRRTFASTADHVVAGNPSKEWLAERVAVRDHAEESTDLWRKISFFVAIPSVIVCTAWVYKVEAEHAAHEEHIKEENGGELPPVPEYAYLNKRGKPFPWGMNALFFNPHTNKDMSESE